MTQPRNRLISLEDTPYYHCIGRCVRRAFLCGFDQFSGQDYEHRRQWVVERLQILSQLFAIEVCSYAVMSNHYHVVLRVNRCQSLTWTDQDVVKRWVKLFSGNQHSRAYLSKEPLTSDTKTYIDNHLPLWRDRLVNISWFMRCLNEYIARKANQEDDCTGRFWEGRFKSQALLDETALITCMAYVDLNPIRAKIASTIETSDYTSIQSRIQGLVSPTDTTEWLIPMQGKSGIDWGLPIELDSYLALVDWTGKAILEGKRGAIPEHLADIMTRLEMQTSDWLVSQKQFGKRYYRAIGSKQRIKSLASKIGQSWLAGQGKQHHFGFG